MFMYHVGSGDARMEVINGHFVGAVTGWQWASMLFIIYPCLLFMSMPLLRILGIILGTLYVVLRVTGDTAARYSIIVLPLALLLYMTIKRGRRWPSVPAAALVATLLTLLVARGHSTLSHMDSRERTLSSVVTSAAKGIAQGEDTALLPTFYRHSELVDRVGFSYGLNTVQYVLFGPLPRKYFPWKSDVFAFVPGVRLQVDMPEKVNYAKPSIIGAFYADFGIVGVVVGMAFLAFLLRKMDGFLDRRTPSHVVVWAAVVLATVWMGVLAELEWWYQETMMISAPFFTLLVLNWVRLRLFAIADSRGA